VGPDQVLTDGDLSAWEQDWRRRWRGRALAVVRPGSTAEVAPWSGPAPPQGLSLVPQGGNTGLVGGGVPDASGTAGAAEPAAPEPRARHRRANLAITAEAGCVLQAVQEAAAAPA
jgi:FAD/FMN-containing dehydrogenase